MLLLFADILVFVPQYELCLQAQVNAMRALSVNKGLTAADLAKTKAVVFNHQRT